MATFSDRNPGNAPGRYYIDSSCIDCDQCRVIAPETFVRDDETGLSHVQRQPLTPEEIALAEEAIGACATESIGNDGF
ncbi:MAG: ferredoxin [Verrucomicrobia bacterium]|nr:ferredoxin [Verrucomicrobiota bacterium]